MGILAALIAIVGLYVTYNFTRNNNELNSLHGESHWRENLTNISSAERIGIHELELFRTCLSATRGIGIYEDSKYPLDYRQRESDFDLDDYCICYYHYLKSKYFSSNFMELPSSENKKTIVFVNDSDDIDVFRQLCRLLLKSDWNKRIGDSISLKFLRFARFDDEPCIKAKNIILYNNNFRKFIKYNSDIYTTFYSSNNLSNTNNIFHNVNKLKFQFFMRFVFTSLLLFFSVITAILFQYKVNCIISLLIFFLIFIVLAEMIRSFLYKLDNLTHSGKLSACVIKQFLNILNIILCNFAFVIKITLIIIVVIVIIIVY